jgi:hypothetical protein
MNTNDETIYKIPELRMVGTRNEIDAALAWEDFDLSRIRGAAITNEDVTKVIGHISQDYEYGDNIFETSLKAKAEKPRKHGHLEKAIGEYADTIYFVSRAGAWGSKESINESCAAEGAGEVCGQEILEYKLVSKNRISYTYETGDDIFNHITTPINHEQQSMCKKQQTIKELTAAATALIEKYNSVIQDREWVAMQAVARVNGFTYRGPWIAQEVEALAKLITANRGQEGACNDRPTDSRPIADAQSGI